MMTKTTKEAIKALATAADSMDTAMRTAVPDVAGVSLGDTTYLLDMLPRGWGHGDVQASPTAW